MAEPKEDPVAARDAKTDGRAETVVIQTVVDKNGFQWVYLARDAAHGHPMGRPGLVLWLISAWFAASGGLEVALVAALGTPWWSGLLGFASLAACVGLILRVPWAYVLAVLLPARFVVGFVMAIGGGAQGLTGAVQADQLFVLAQAIIAIAVTFHLIEGERPNLIYRLRYRSYAAEREVAASAQAQKDPGGPASRS